MTNEQHIENLKKLKSFHNGSYGADIDIAIKSLEQEPKTGLWIENAPEYQNIDPPYICSECGNMHLKKTNYCDQCGAKMVEPQERSEE